jgi:hypothetical protein
MKRIKLERNEEIDNVNNGTALVTLYHEHILSFLQLEVKICIS